MNNNARGGDWWAGIWIGDVLAPIRGNSVQVPHRAECAICPALVVVSK